MKRIIITIYLVINVFTVFCQTPPNEFFKGLDLVTTKPHEAKKEFQSAIIKDSTFHGSYHFLGVIYLNDKAMDSAIICFKKSILLNTKNGSHTREMAYARLILAYLYKLDFTNSFIVAKDALYQYPENNVIKQYLKDVCLWSFYINHNGLDSSYLTTDLKEEYIVNSVPEEYLILRTLRINDEPLNFESQMLLMEEKANYDVLTCSQKKSGSEIELKFRLNWDFKTEKGGRVVNTDNIYNNSELLIHERIGALLVDDSNIDILKEYEKLSRK